MFRIISVLFCTMVLSSFYTVAQDNNTTTKQDTLIVYTYQSFISDWGPGQALKEQFESQCHCNVEYIAVDDSVVLLNRLRLTNKGDIVLGLDTNLIAEAKRTNLVQSHDLSVTFKETILWEDNEFIPYDHGYFSFIYDSTKISNPPNSFEALLDDPNSTIIYQDPRTSTPGLGLLLWINSLYDAEHTEAAWKKLSQKTVTVTSGWSEAYSLFLKGEADFVLSYSTSPVVHILNDNENKYKSVNFEEGHYQQIEVAGILKTTHNKALAQQFLMFLLTPETQYEIATKNIMYPVIDIALPDAYEQIAKPKGLQPLAGDIVQSNKIKWIRTWLNSVSN